MYSFKLSWSEKSLLSLSHSLLLTLRLLLSIFLPERGSHSASQADSRFSALNNLPVAVRQTVGIMGNISAAGIFLAFVVNIFC